MQRKFEKFGFDIEKVEKKDFSDQLDTFYPSRKALLIAWSKLEVENHINLKPNYNENNTTVKYNTIHSLWYVRLDPEIEIKEFNVCHIIKFKQDAENELDPNSYSVQAVGYDIMDDWNSDFLEG